LIGVEVQFAREAAMAQAECLVAAIKIAGLRFDNEALIIGLNNTKELLEKHKYSATKTVFSAFAQQINPELKAGVEQDLDAKYAHIHDSVLRLLKSKMAEAILEAKVETKNSGDAVYARMAIDEARKSISENDNRPHPWVGAVVVKDGKVLSKAHRGEVPGNHAEFVALEKNLRNVAVTGATVYTTLEPCTTRTPPKIPCVDRLIERKVARVVIGILDPDDRIRGKGQRKLSNAGIETALFPHDLAMEVEELNREFTRYCEQQTRKEEPRTQENRQDWPDVLLTCHWRSQTNSPATSGFHIVRDRVWELSATSVGTLYNVQIQDIDFGEFRALFEPVDCLANDVVPRNAQILDLETNNVVRTHDLETLFTHSPTGCDIARYATNDPLAFEIPVCVTYSNARGNKFAIGYIFKYDVYHEEGRIVRNGGIKKL
jgi:pyrimidine deaminase RibD-like protein